MRKIALSCCVALFVVTSVLEARAASLAGVALPDTVQAGDTTLVLNGLGLRKKMLVKVYVAGLYVKQKSSDAGAILDAGVPKRLVMQFVRGVSKDQLVEAFAESFDNNAPEARKTMKADLDRFFGAIEAVKEGDQLVFTYLPGKGTTVAIHGKEKLTIEATAFSSALFSVWLGPKPPTADLKKGILGL